MESTKIGKQNRSLKVVNCLCIINAICNSSSWDPIKFSNINGTFGDFSIRSATPENEQADTKSNCSDAVSPTHQPEKIVLREILR